jgi:hypothetical protein
MLLSSPELLATYQLGELFASRNEDLDAAPIILCESSCGMLSFFVPPEASVDDHAKRVLMLGRSEENW